MTQSTAKGLGATSLAACRRLLGERKIKPIEKDPGNYDVVVIVCPLWVGIIPPPIRTYISENKNKLDRIALLSVSGDGPGNKKGVSDFESSAGKKVLANLLLTENQFKQGNYKEELQSFATSHLN